MSSTPSVNPEPGPFTPSTSPVVPAVSAVSAAAPATDQTPRVAEPLASGLSATGPAATGPAATGPAATGPAATGVAPELVEETKNHIRQLVHEITRLTQSDLSLEDFYDEFLKRVVAALASAGGAIWTADDEGRLRLQYQINLSATGLAHDLHDQQRPQDQQRHALLLKKVLAAGAPTLVPPRSGTADEEEAGNPTDFLLVLGTLVVEQRVQGLVEIFQRPGGGPTTQRGYLRFLAQMCELAGDFLKNQRLRQFHQRQALWDHLEQFLGAIHRSLEVRETAMTIANEGRRLLACDRVSVALLRGKRRYVVEAVSGLDTLDRRSGQLLQLGHLASVVLAAGEPLWYTGQAGDLPPQVQRALHGYLDQSHAKMLAIVPLRGPDAGVSSGGAAPDRPSGALIVEQLQDSRLIEGLPKRVEVVTDHGGKALANALAYENLFLLPVWRALGKARWMVQTRNLPKTVLGLALTAGLFLLLLLPADFDVAARGTLQPAQRREIFARLDGVVTDVAVEHGQRVAAGQVLARMRNTDLEVELTTLLGKQTTTHERYLAVQRALLNDARLSTEEQIRLSGELEQLEQTAASLVRQLAIYRQKEELLTLRSPLAGQVVTWQVGQTLLRRPVERGQILMSVVAPEGDWELELQMPERRMGHVAAAERGTSGDLPLTFILATHPGRKFAGRVREIERTADVRGDVGSSVLIRASIDKEQLPELRSDTSVTARVRCGRRPIAYVWFHDLIETVQANILFWL